MSRRSISIWTASAAAFLTVAALAACGSPGVRTQSGSTGSLTLYVAPGGNGSGNGTRSSPYTTIAEARDALRPRLASMHGDATVILEDGTYTLTTPLTFTPDDSGRNGHSVVYEAAPGAHPVISGGYSVGTWRRSPGALGRSNIWVASVPSWLRTRQLYVDGVRAPVAQAPAPATFIPTADGYTDTSGTMQTWSNPGQIEMIYPSGPSNWTESRCRVASITGPHVTMVEPCWGNTTLRATPGTPLNISGFGQSLSSSVIVSDALALLNQPGQWYLDGARNLLYYMPLPGQDMGRVHAVVPRLETLLQGDGTAGATIHDIAFRGITFSYATWLGPSGPDGYSSFQAGAHLTGADAYRLQGACDSRGASCPYMSMPLVPGNVSFTFDTGLSFTGDVFEHLGAAGLSLGDGTQNATVQGDLFTDTSGSGLSLGGIDQPLAQGSELVSGNVVTDNYFHATSAEYQDNAALFVGYAQYTTIAHNQIDDVPYSGISIGWGGWMERLADLGPLSNYSRGNVIANNLIFDHMKVIVDGGGIYTNGIEGSTQANAEVIENNVVLGQHHPSWGIYTDNGTQFVDIVGNVVYDALYEPGLAAVIPGLSPYFSFGGCGGGPIAYSGNYSVQDDPSAGLISANPLCGGHPLLDVTVTDNHLISALDQVPAAVISGAGVEAPYAVALGVAPAPQGLPPYTQP